MAGFDSPVDILNPAKVILYEIKASASGEIEPDQKTRLLALMDGDDIVKVRPSRIYNANLGGFVPSPRYRQPLSVLRNVGIGATVVGGGACVWAILHHEKYESQWVEAREALFAAKNETDAYQKGVSCAFAFDKVRAYLSNFMPASEVAGIELIQIYKMAAQM